MKTMIFGDSKRLKSSAEKKEKRQLKNMLLSFEQKE
jgi:hypothetical protein